MRLTKIQKALKQENIEYAYQENKGCGEIDFKYEGKNYMVHEITGNHGNTPIGIYTNIQKMCQFGKQGRIVEAIITKKF